MTLFFNIDRLEKETNNDPIYLVVALKHWFTKKLVPKNTKQKYKPLKGSLTGSSFMLNPKDFFANTTTDIIWRAQYIRLCARRDYGLYKLYGFRFLDLSFMPDVNLDAIKHNPLLKITDNKVYFIYEEK